MMILWIILVFWQNSLLLWLVFFYFEFLNPCKAEGFVISLLSVARLISFFCFFCMGSSGHNEWKVAEPDFFDKSYFSNFLW